MEETKPHFASSKNVHIDEAYASWIEELKGRYKKAQIKSAVKVNSEQLLFNWQLGRDLVVRRAEEHWGAGVVEQVSLDLKAAFPKAKGFSARNLWNMKKWYIFYSSNKTNQKLQQLVAELQTSDNKQKTKLQQLGADRIDMLFYHIHLRSYIVCELKAKPFEPEFAGKLNFYVNAVDELLKTDDDNPTIGLLICKDKNQTEVKWAFKGISTPMGVASYDKVRIKKIREVLPSEEDLSRQLQLFENKRK